MLSTRSSFVLCSLLLVAALSPTRAAGDPWRLDDAIGDERVSLSVVHRTRYEYLSEQFRAGAPGEDEALVLRTLIHGRVRPIEGVTLGAELEDSRAYETDDLNLNTTIVNTAELLRAYAQLTRDDVLGGSLRATAGRITMDVGSRRFVARNRYRNTINGFTGVDVEWKSAGDDRSVVRGFWALPVDRRPQSNEEARLRRNAVEFDDETTRVQFWGLFLGRGLQCACDLDLELFAFGLHERDSDRRPTRNRELTTLGGRLLRKPSKGAFDYVLEGAVQFGRSRASTSAADTNNLDHLAHFEHLEVGYTFDAPWSPRLALQYDYASGDDDPNDDDNGRFDTLYGARRFDFGPTGIYGPFARSNLNTPGVRLQVKPASNVTGFVAWRAYWLASERDAWTTSGLADSTGASSSYIGNQLEFRVRWRPLPGNLLLDGGYAHLFEGRFPRQAPGSTARGDSNYFYLQVVVTL